MASTKWGKSSRQVIDFSVPIWLEGLQDGQGVRKEDNFEGSMSAGFNMSCCCFQGFCFSFVVCGVQAGSEANFVFFASCVLYVDSCPSIPNCILSRAISVPVGPGLFWVVSLANKIKLK